MIALTSAHNDNPRYGLPCADGSRHTALLHLYCAFYWATHGGRRQSIPIKFISENGVVLRPRRGHRYRVITSQDAGD